MVDCPAVFFGIYHGKQLRKATRYVGGDGMGEGLVGDLNIISNICSARPDYRTAIC